MSIALPNSRACPGITAFQAGLPPELGRYAGSQKQLPTEF